MATKIGILQCGDHLESVAEKHHSHSALFQKLFAGSQLSFETFRVNINEFPQQVDVCDGYVITGSPMGVYEDHDWIAPLEQLVRDCFAASIPIIGICFGHQLMAQALGGKVEKFAGGWSVGQVDYQSSDGKTVTLNAFHQDQVITPPEGSTTFLSSDFCKHAGLSYGKKGMSIQPHPEMGADYIKDLLDAKGRKLLQEKQLSDAYDSLTENIDVDVATRMLLSVLSPELKMV